MNVATAKERLLETGLELIHERGYHATGIQDILATAEVPRGSFYHYFPGKEAFCLAVIDRYAERGYHRLDSCLSAQGYSPLQRARRFFDETRALYAAGECRRGCLLGNLGQELADVSEVCRRRVNRHLESWTVRLAQCLREAQDAGELAGDIDANDYAAVLLNSWEGALLRMKLVRSVEPLDAFTRLYFDSVLKP
ncbi:MAG: TetR family transcriptional regulator C-terminal domain-containing protein [Gammaproteobacteria bacterium]